MGITGWRRIELVFALSEILQYGIFFPPDSPLTEILGIESDKFGAALFLLFMTICTARAYINQLQAVHALAV